MPGYINGEFEMNLGDFENAYSSFVLYFDIINTVDDEGNSSLYRVTASTTQTGIDVSVFVDTDNNLIPRGTISPSDIRSDTEATATVVLTVSSPSGAKVELDKITVVITREPEIYSNYSFATNEDGTATLTSYTGDETNVVIPETISVRTVDGQTQYIQGKEYRVTSIADASSYTQGAFYNVRTKIESVSFPETLTHIGDYAFYNCRDISTLDLPDSLESIGIHAFHGCKALTSLEFPANVTSIGREVFSNSGVQTVTFAEGSKLTEIGEYVFQDGHSINSVLLPESVTAIGAYAFRDCQSLTEITIPASVQIIGEYAFRDSGVQMLTFAKNSKLTALGDYAFANANSLTRIELPEGLQTIGEYTFLDCAMPSLTIPASVESISVSSFGGCFALSEIYNYSNVDLSDLSLEPGSFESGLGNLVPKTLYTATELSQLAEKPASKVQEIGNVFYYVDGEDYIALTISSSIQPLDIVLDYRTIYIERSAFADSNLQTIDFSLCKSLEYIEQRAFSRCDGLTELDFSECDSFRRFYDDAFSECSNLTSVILAESTTVICRGVFSSTSLESLIFPTNSDWIFYDKGRPYTYTYSQTLSNPETAAHLLSVSYNEEEWSRIN